jgi:predicted RNase H-like HicB family nuclease
MKRTIEVQATRSQGWWAVSCDEVPLMHTQAKRLDQCEVMAREALAICLGAPETSLDVVVVVADDFVRAAIAELERADAAAERAAEAAREAARWRRAVVAGLARRELSTRDVGRLLGMSHQRVSQMLREEQTNETV